MTQPLDYSPVPVQNRLNPAIFYRIALACAIVPGLLGIAIFLLWLLIRGKVLELLGIIVILGGTGLALAGFICLVLFTVHGPYDPQYRGKVAWKAGIAAFFLFVNFPLAWGILLTVNDISSRWHVTVINQSGATLDEFVIHPPRMPSQDIGPIPPGGSAKLTFYIGGDGALTFSARQSNLRFSGVMNGYVTSGLEAEQFTITVGPNQQTTIQSLRP